MLIYHVLERTIEYGDHDDSMSCYAVVSALINGDVTVQLFLHDHFSCMSIGVD